MNVDVLLQRYKITENGTSLTTCPGLIIVNWLPPGNVQTLKPGGREVILKDDLTMTLSDGYQDQFLMRAQATGKSWLEVQVISMHDFGLIGKLLAELATFASKKLPIPFGSALFDLLSDTVKKGAPQIIAAGRSQYFSPGALPSTITVDLSAPSDILGEMTYREADAKTGDDWRGDREVLMKKGTPNGSITFGIEAVANDA